MVAWPGFTEACTGRLFILDQRTFQTLTLVLGHCQFFVGFCLFFSCSSLYLLSSLFSALQLFDNQELYLPLLPRNFTFLQLSKVWPPSARRCGCGHLCRRGCGMETTVAGCNVHTLSFTFLQFHLCLFPNITQQSHVHSQMHPVSPAGW